MDHKLRRGRGLKKRIILALTGTVLALALVLTNFAGVYPTTVYADTNTLNITFVVVNGAWNDGTTDNKTVTKSRPANEDLALQLLANEIPAVGNNPNAGYAAGSWDTTPIEKAYAQGGDYTYTYTYSSTPITFVSAEIIAPDSVVVGQDFTVTLKYTFSRAPISETEEVDCASLVSVVNTSGISSVVTFPQASWNANIYSRPIVIRANAIGTIDIDAKYNYTVRATKAVTATEQSTTPDPDPVVEDNTPQPDQFDELLSSFDAAVALGGKQVVEWNEGESLPASIMKYLQEHPNLTLVFSYTYKDVDYKVVIPGKYVVIDPEATWYGPMNLYGTYGKYSLDETSKEIVSSDVAAETAVEAAAAQETPAHQEYVIKSGDTLNAIARNLGVTVRVICELNGIENPNRIRAGRTIKY